MIMWTKRSRWAHGIAFLVAPLCLAGVLAAAQQRPPETTGKGMTSRQRFKNIRVLKTLPADQLIPVMHRFNQALNVNCEFCHVVGPNHSGFELDTKPQKEAARKMILLTQRLNAREHVLNGRATCFMCHHGHPEPQTTAEAVQPQQAPEKPEKRDQSETKD